MRLVLRLIAITALLAGGATVVTATLGPASALGAPSAYQSVVKVYEREGQIPACQFSSGQLERALGGVDTYGAQYFADFTQAIQSALSSRAAGACSADGAPGRGPGAGRHRAAGRGPRPHRALPAAQQPLAHFPALTAATSAGVPAPLVGLAILAGAGALLGIGNAAWRLRRR